MKVINLIISLVLGKSLLCLKSWLQWYSFSLPLGTSFGEALYDHKNFKINNNINFN